MIFQQKDRQIFANRVDDLSLGGSFTSCSEFLLTVGQSFLDAPYAPNTLEGPVEALRINLREFDCVTYVENCIALTMELSAEQPTFEGFAARLQLIRYRYGRIDSYSSRLHYFSDWLFDNEQKGVLHDLTRDLNGRPQAKKMRHMTDNWHLYPALLNAENFRAISEVERILTGRNPRYISKESLPGIISSIIGGDIIAITDAASNLDVSHVGLAIYVGEQCHLLHASEKAGRVVISEQPLSDYLSSHQNHSGVMVARLDCKTAPDPR
ncbi:MAG: DUF1460 domain-containing protein [Smithellaceae bacterium]|nr:DUF1460 domain-containing protein [Smithellaceae bacterium]